MTQASGNIYVFPKTSNRPLETEISRPEPNWTRALLKEVQTLPCVQIDIIHEALWAMSNSVTGIANSPRSVKETWAIMIKVDGTILSLARALTMLVHKRQPEDRREQEARARTICRHSLINTRMNADLIVEAARGLMDAAESPVA